MSKLTLPRLLAIVTLILAALPVIGTVAYFFLSVFHQHAYGLLDIRLDEVGLDRGRLIDDTVAGVAVLFFATPVIIAAYGGALWMLSRTGSWLFRTVGQRLPIDPNSRVGKALRRPARTTSITRKWLLRSSAIVLGGGSIVLFAFMWSAGGIAARGVQDSIAYSGKLASGVRALDFDAVPFRFTKLPRTHTFDRGCVLYLGHADGHMVLYDTRKDRPLRLPEAEYEGEQLDPDTVGLPNRCDQPADEATVMVSAATVEDVDSAPGVLVWVARPPHQRFWLLMASQAGKTRLLARGDRRMQPDLGRLPSGGLTVTYRACRDGRCTIRQRELPGDHASTMRVPDRAGCEATWPVRHTGASGVILAGARCSGRNRGVWLRSGGGPWRRVPTTGLAIGDLDALGDRLAWIERRGGILRVRAVGVTGQPSTIYEDAEPLAGVSSSLRSLHLVRDGALWLRMVAQHPETQIVSWRRRDATCRVQRSLQDVTGATRVAVGVGETFVATASTLRRLPVAIDGGGGDRLDGAPTREIAVQRCVGERGRG